MASAAGSIFEWTGGARWKPGSRLSDDPVLPLKWRTRPAPRRNVHAMEERRPRLGPRAADTLVVAAVAGIALFGLFGPVWIGGARIERISGAAVVLALTQAGALWWRRQQPVVVLAVTLAALVMSQAVGDENAASFFGPHAAAYSVAAYGSRRQSFIGLAAIGIAGALDAVIVGWVNPAAGAVALSPTGIIVILVWVVGRYVTVRRAYLATLLSYTRQLERDRDVQSQRAVLEERRRIARELHDQVAHHLGVVSLHTAAARRWLDRDPDQTAAALEAAEQASRTALETMPAILHALRADDARRTRAPQPTLDDLTELASNVAAVGVPVEVHISGDRRRLHPTVELTAYRIVQEALTNTFKHAGPARARVQVHYGSDRLEVEVHDDGNGLAAPATNGSRLGLVGMRERIELVGGELTTGPREGGGFAVHAVLPAIGGSRTP